MAACGTLVRSRSATSLFSGGPISLLRVVRLMAPPLSSRGGIPAHLSLRNRAFSVACHLLELSE